MKEALRILLYQQGLIGRIPDDDFGRIRSEQPDFVCLPEYFFIPSWSTGHQAEAAHADAHLKKLKEWSVKLNTVLIGGSIVERVGDRYLNTSYVFDRGHLVGSYSKINLFGGEIQSGLSPGTQYRAFDIEGVRIGVLICADVLNPNSFLEMEQRDCDIVFVPTTSPYKTESVAEKFERDSALFEHGARRCRALIAKCCAVGTIFGNPLQGRSLLASPEGIVQRVDPARENEPQMIVHDISLSRIRRWKKESGHRNG